MCGSGGGGGFLGTDLRLAELLHVCFKMNVLKMEMFYDSYDLCKKHCNH